MPPHHTDRGHIRIVGGQDEEVRRARHDLEAPEHRFQRDLDRLNGRARHVTASPSYFAMLAADWRDIIREVRASPYSHALVAILTVVGWTVLLVVPTLLGAGK